MPLLTLLLLAAPAFASEDTPTELPADAPVPATYRLVTLQTVSATAPGNFDPQSSGAELVLVSQWTVGTTFQVLGTTPDASRLSLSGLQGGLNNYNGFDGFDEFDRLDVGDFDADGTSDLVVSFGTERWIFLRQGSTFQDSRHVETKVPGPDDPLMQYGKTCGANDVDGDGKADLARLMTHFAPPPYTDYQWLGSKTDYKAIASWVGPETLNGQCVGQGDIDGDGRADAVLQVDAGTTRNWFGVVSWARVNPTVWTSTRSGGVEGILLADANGDGKADLWLQYDANGQRVWQVRLSDGKSFPTIYATAIANTADGPYRNLRLAGLGDVDGDGKADLWLQYDDPQGTRHWEVRRSTGTAFAAPAEFSKTSSAAVDALAIADADGDGKADLWVQWDRSATDRQYQVRLSAGTTAGATLGGAGMTMGRSTRIEWSD